MVKTGQASIVLAGNDEVLAVALTGLQAVKRHVNRVTVEPTADVDVLVYFDQLLVVDIESGVVPGEAPYVPVDADVAVGVTMRVGYRKRTAGAATLTVAWEYVEG